MESAQKPESQVQHITHLINDVAEDLNNRTSIINPLIHNSLFDFFPVRNIENAEQIETNFPLNHQSYLPEDIDIDELSLSLLIENTGLEDLSNQDSTAIHKVIRPSLPSFDTLRSRQPDDVAQSESMSGIINPRNLWYDTDKNCSSSSYFHQISQDVLSQSSEYAGVPQQIKSNARDIFWKDVSIIQPPDITSRMHEVIKSQPVFSVSTSTQTDYVLPTESISQNQNINPPNFMHPIESKVATESSRDFPNAIRHKTNNNNKNTFTCRECGATFNTHDSFTRHMHVHTGPRPMICEICGKSFKKASYFVFHKRTHTKSGTHVLTQISHKCDICGKAYRHLSSLWKHTKIHTNFKPWLCEHCGRIFREKRSYKYHIILHSGEKAHKCTVCNKDFYHACNLKSHMNTHEKTKPYKCKECGKSYCHKTTLTRHMRKKHNNGI